MRDCALAHRLQFHLVRPTSKHRFRRWGEVSHGETAEGLIRLHDLEIARLDNDRSHPENGKIEFFMEGGL